MPNVFRCPACGRDLEAPDAAFSVSGSCRFCGAQIVSPSGPDGPATLVAVGPSGMQVAPGDVSQPTGHIDPGEILSEAWALLKVHWAIILAANLIVGVIYLGALAPWFVPVIQGAIKNPGSPAAQQQLPLVAQAAIMAISVLLAPLLAGPLYLIDRIIVRGDDSMGAVFAGFRHYVPLAKFAFVYSMPFVLLQLAQGALTASSPGRGLMLSIATWPVTVLWMIVFRPGQMEVIDRGVDGVAAMKASWEFTKGHRLMILVTGILLGLCYMAGFIACCIGVLFTVGFLPLGEVLIYRHLRGLQGTPDA